MDDVIEIDGFISVRQASREYKITLQRMHVLLRRWGVSKYGIDGLTGHVVSRDDLSRIPQHRPSGKSLKIHKP